MKQLSSLEKALTEAHEGLPHLPESWRVWLGNNVWWLVLIGVVAGVLGIVSSLMAMTIGTAVVTGAYGVAVGASVFTASVVSLITLALVVVIEAAAIQPLQTKKKRGWDLLFVAVLVSVVGNLVSAVVGSALLPSLVGLVLAAAVSFYLLFELRGQFLSQKKLPKSGA